MNFECPNCQSQRIKVTKTEPHKNHIIRERYCNTCNKYFTTIELYKKDYYNKLKSQINKFKQQIDNLELF